MSLQQHTTCPVCTKPFSSSKNHLPKLLRCRHTICLSCITQHCLTDAKNAVICLKCTKRTYLEGVATEGPSDAIVTPENGLITNYRFLMQEHSAMTEQAAKLRAMSPSSPFSSSSLSCPTILLAKNGSSIPALQGDNNNNNNETILNRDGHLQNGDEDHDDDEDGEDEEDEDKNIDDGLSFLADCEAPGCEEKATGRCEGCGGAAFCNTCYQNHLKHLPKSVQEKHNFGSVADSQLCPKHKLPRQLFCLRHNKAVCATCASLHHRQCRDIRELSAVVETLRPQIAKRKEKLFELFKVALNSCYELKNEISRIDQDAEETIANLLNNAYKCVEATLASAYQVQLSAFQRKLELDHALRTLSVEAGSFAEEVEEINDLLLDDDDDDDDGGDASIQNERMEGSNKTNNNKNINHQRKHHHRYHHPDPAKVARHAPAEKPELHTIIPSGSIIKSELVFEVRQDLKQFWQRRGAAVIPEILRRKNPAFSSSSMNGDDEDDGDGDDDEDRDRRRVSSSRSSPHQPIVTTKQNNNNKNQSASLSPSPRSKLNNNNNDSSTSSNKNQFTNRIASATKTIPTKFQTRFGRSQGTTPDAFSFPRGLATLPNGNIAVCDTNNHRIQILNPTFCSSSSKSISQSIKSPSSTTTNLLLSSASTSQYTKGARRKRDEVVGSFVTFIRLRVVPGGNDNLHPAFPLHICTLPNGILFVLDNENRCGYFVDGMKKMRQQNNEVQEDIVKCNGVDDAETKDSLAIWKYPSSWEKPSGICLLPATGEIAVIDEARHLVSVLDKNLRNVVREFDGVDLVEFSKASSSSSSSSSPSSISTLAREDMIHRIESPKAICSIPLQCPWGENVFDTLFDDMSTALISSSPRPRPTSWRTNNGKSAAAFDEEEIRVARKLKKKKQRENRQITDQVDDFSHTKISVGTNKKIHHSHRSSVSPSLIVVCSDRSVSILDAQTGAFVRFVGGDASQSRIISRPWGVCASDDGRRIAIVDAVQSCIYIANVSDGNVIVRVAYHTNQTFFGGNAFTNQNLQSPSSLLGSALNGLNGSTGMSSSCGDGATTPFLNTSTASSPTSRSQSVSAPVVVAAAAAAASFGSVVDRYSSLLLSKNQQLHPSTRTTFSNSAISATMTSFFPQNIITVPANGKLVVTDIVSHTVCILETVL